MSMRGECDEGEMIRLGFHSKRELARASHVQFREACASESHFPYGIHGLFNGAALDSHDRTIKKDTTKYWLQ